MKELRPIWKAKRIANLLVRIFKASAEDELMGMAKKVQRMVSIYVTTLDEKDINSLTDENAEDASDRFARLELYEKMRTAIGKIIQRRSRNHHRLLL